MAMYGTLVMKAGCERGFKNAFGSQFGFALLPKKTAKNEQQALDIALEQFEAESIQYQVMDDTMEVYEIRRGGVVIGWDVSADGINIDYF